jgi:hypothetical protein
LPRERQSGTVRPVTLLLDLYGFLQERRRCGDRESTVEEIIPGGECRVWFTCTCAAAMTRSADDD